MLILTTELLHYGSISEHDCMRIKYLQGYRMLIIGLKRTMSLSPSPFSCKKYALLLQYTYTNFRLTTVSVTILSLVLHMQLRLSMIL